MSDKRRVPRGQRLSSSIKSGMIIRKLSDHVRCSDTTPMTSTQIQAARILLSKTCPDLKAIEVSVDDVSGDPHAISAAALMQVIDSTAVLLGSEPDKAIKHEQKHTNKSS